MSSPQYFRHSVIGMIAILVIAGCQSESPDAGASPSASAPPALPVQVFTVKAQANLQQRLYPGRLEAMVQADVRARTDGVVEERLFEEGQTVSQGDVLYQLDDSRLVSTLNVQKANVERAKAALQLAKISRQRAENLKPKKLISPQDYDQAVSGEAEALASLKAAEATLAATQVELDYTRVTAPVDGVIGRTLVTRGALVGKNEATHMATIRQLDPIWVNMQIPEHAIVALNQSLSGNSRDVQVDLQLPDNSDYDVSGKIVFVDTAVNRDTGTVEVRAEFPNANNVLLPGQFVRARIRGVHAADTIFIPQRAVLSNAQGTFVWRLDDNQQVQPQSVTTGSLQGELWEVNAGLGLGDQIALSNLQKLQPGMRVAPLTEQD